ncbi:hypothetical protein [Ochrobactrum sp. BTU1]|uniref:hypothetical protein n=1 Tax=Ochrobactrum sp. BTU1 TaxID=2840456 RepID=UPI001C05949B|nr:hypothetical protein KMS41_19605 [Ochrobactrum sp. BTU1]
MTIPYFHHDNKFILGEVGARPPGGGGSSAIKAVLGEGTKQLELRAAINQFDGAPVITIIEGAFTGYVDLRPFDSGVIVDHISKAELLMLPGVVDVDIHCKLGQFFEHNSWNNWCIVAIIMTKTEDEFYETIETAKRLFWCKLA